MQKHELVDNIAFGSSPCIILTLTLNKPRIAGFIQVKVIILRNPLNPRFLQVKSYIFINKYLFININIYT